MRWFAPIGLLVVGIGVFHAPLIADHAEEVNQLEMFASKTDLTEIRFGLGMRAEYKWFCWIVGGLLAAIGFSNIRARANHTDDSEPFGGLASAICIALGAGLVLIPSISDSIRELTIAKHLAANSALQGDSLGFGINQDYRLFCWIAGVAVMARFFEPLTEITKSNKPNLITVATCAFVGTGLVLTPLIFDSIRGLTTATILAANSNINADAFSSGMHLGYRWFCWLTGGLLLLMVVRSLQRRYGKELGST